jgi:betaine-aldehyde dehydrogenase
LRKNAAAASEAADRAFRLTDWKDNRRLRAKVLNQIADRFEARRDDLIRILSLEDGKVHDEAAFEVDMIPHKFRYWASFVLASYGRALEVEPGHLCFVTRSPIGVAGVIAPFNSPLVLTVRSLAQRLELRALTILTSAMSELRHQNTVVRLITSGAWLRYIVTLFGVLKYSD